MKTDMERESKKTKLFSFMSVCTLILLLWGKGIYNKNQDELDVWYSDTFNAEYSTKKKIRFDSEKDTSTTISEYMLKNGETKKMLQEIWWTNEQKIGNKSIHRVKIFSTLSEKEYSQQRAEIERCISILPDSMIQRYIHAIVLWKKPSDTKINTKNDVSGFVNPPFHIIKLQFDQYSEFEKITFFHEFSHIVLRHGFNKYFLHTWEDKFWGISSKDEEFAGHEINDENDESKKYGMTNMFEDMATFSQELFSTEGWKKLREWSKKDPIFSEKLKTILKFWDDASDGEMDEEYFIKIERGEVKI